MIGSGFDLNHFHCKISLLLSIVRSLRNKRRLTSLSFEKPAEFIVESDSSIKVSYFHSRDLNGKD